MSSCGDIFEVVLNMDTKSPCYMCARMRRGYLYSKAKELGCNKIALGHHFDDVIETTLLSMLYGSEIKKLINDLRAVNKNADYNIFKALDNVNLNCILGTKKDGEYRSFLENYEKKD